MRPELRIAAAVILVFLAGFGVVKTSEWVKQKRENRQWVAVNNITPDRLIARCGAPMQDDTKNLYPMIAREMSYKATSGAAVLFSFSRTAEEGSDWVFMSMKNSAGDSAFETPKEKIEAMPCLDSRK